MRALVLLLALCLHVGPARADPPHLDIYPPFGLPSGRSFFVDIVRDGTWNEGAIRSWADDGNYATPRSYVYVTLDDAPLATLIFYQQVPYPDRLPGDPSSLDIYYKAWSVMIPVLDPGEHTLAAAYEGDRTNPGTPAVWNFTIGPHVSLEPLPRSPKPFDRPPGRNEPAQPTGFVTLTDITSLDVLFRPVEDLVVVDPVTLELSLDLSWLTRDTVVTYQGDPNFAPFNYTHLANPALAEPIPAPPPPLALALLALAALRIRRPAVLGSAPCPMPTSSTCVSTPAIR